MMSFSKKSDKMNLEFSFWDKSFRFNGHHKQWWLSRPVSTEYADEVIEMAEFFYELGKQAKSEELRKLMGFNK